MAKRRAASNADILAGVPDVGEETALDPATMTPIQTTQTTVRRFVEYPQAVNEDDDEGVVVDEPTDQKPIDPFAAFTTMVSTNQDAMIRLWLLPSYDVNGQTAASVHDRTFCGTIPFNPDDPGLLDSIRARVQKGGMLSLELLIDGRMAKRGLLRVGAVEGYQQQQQQQPGVVIQQAPAPTQPPIDPLEMIKKQTETFVAVAGLIKQLQPDNHAVAPQQVVVEPPPVRERLLEGVLVKMLESPKEGSLDRIADLLSGGRESSWVDTAITTMGPQLGQFLTQIGPGLSAWLMRLAGASPVQQTPQAPGAPIGAVQQQPAADPAQRAWQRVYNRLLEDLFEHAQLIQSGQPDGLDQRSSMAAIVDLADRFSANQNIVGTIRALLNSQPSQVLDMCISVSPNLAPQLTELKNQPAVLDWLTELQRQTLEALETLSSDEEDNPENQSDEVNDNGA